MDDYRRTNVANMRVKIKDILDGTAFLRHRYIVTRHGEPVAQITPPPPSSPPGGEIISVTDIRNRTREILDAVHNGRTFLVFRYGRLDAIMQPVQSFMEAMK